MSVFGNPNFVNEFAYRTKINYYRRKAQFLTAEEQQKYLEMISMVEDEMSKRGFKVDPYYEITDLINSLIGLLVFPEQNVFKYIDSTEEGLKRKFPTIYALTFSKDYKNTYVDENKGRTPQLIFKHKKKSLSHKRIMIFPESTYSSDKIEYVVFKDEHFNKLTKKKEHFSIRIPTSQLENVIIEISNYLISIKP